MINTEDGTLQNQLERQAHRFANDLAPILDALPVGVARIDNRLRYVFVNCVYGTYFGRSASDIVGQRVEDIIGLEAFTTAGAKMQAALAGEAQTFEIPVRFADGKSHHLHVRFVPDRSLSGRVIGFYAVVADMSDTRERKAEVEAMRDRFDELTRRQVAQQTIIAVAHELRQPLHAAGVFAEIARKECRAPSRSRELEHALTRTGEEIDRASSVLTHLFDSIRNNGGDPLTAVARIDLNSLVATVMAHYKDRHPGMAACFEAALDKEALPVVVTPAAIEKILINLLRNASDALVCEDGCPPAARIAVGTHLDRGRAIMCVTDNAGGVPATIRPHLFEPFHTTKASGLGIGLSICKQLAEYQHGRLWHEDRPGGSAFLLSLPLAP